MVNNPQMAEQPKVEDIVAKESIENSIPLDENGEIIYPEKTPQEKSEECRRLAEEFRYGYKHFKETGDIEPMKSTYIDAGDAVRRGNDYVEDLLGGSSTWFVVFDSLCQFSPDAKEFTISVLDKAIADIDSNPTNPVVWPNLSQVFTIDFFENHYLKDFGLDDLAEAEAEGERAAIEAIKAEMKAERAREAEIVVDAEPSAIRQQHTQPEPQPVAEAKIKEVQSDTVSRADYDMLLKEVNNLKASIAQSKAEVTNDEVEKEPEVQESQVKKDILDFENKLRLKTVEGKTLTAVGEVQKVESDSVSDENVDVETSYSDLSEDIKNFNDKIMKGQNMKIVLVDDKEEKKYTTEDMVATGIGCAIAAAGLMYAGHKIFGKKGDSVMKGASRPSISFGTSSIGSFSSGRRGGLSIR